MHAEHKRFLERRYGASKWHGRGQRSRGAIRDFSFDGSEVRGWTLLRVRRDEHAKPLVIRSLWCRAGSTNELLSVDVFVCASVKEALDQLIEALGNIESDAVERRAGKSAFGDVAFALGETMALFSRANVVLLIRNAGPMVVPVGAVARGLDALLMRRLEPERP